jgi:hypothetical protein
MTQKNCFHIESTFLAFARIFQFKIRLLQIFIPWLYIGAIPNPCFVWVWNMAFTSNRTETEDICQQCCRKCMDLRFVGWLNLGLLSDVFQQRGRTWWLPVLNWKWYGYALCLFRCKTKSETVKILCDFSTLDQIFSPVVGEHWCAPTIWTQMRFTNLSVVRKCGNGSEFLFGPVLSSHRPVLLAKSSLCRDFSPLFICCTLRFLEYRLTFL